MSLYKTYLEKVEPVIKSPILEGGHVFSDLEGATDKILRENIEPTISEFNKQWKKVFPKSSLDFGDVERAPRLGSVGKKDISGDIDLGIDSKEIIGPDGDPKFAELGIDEKEFIQAFDDYKKRARTATDEDLVHRSIIKLMAYKINAKKTDIKASETKSGSTAIYCSFPQITPSGKKVPDKFVQIDVNIGPLSWLKFSYFSSGQFTGNLKGLHKTQLIAAMFDAFGYTFKHDKGVKKGGETVAVTPNQALEILNKESDAQFTLEDINDFNKLWSKIQKSKFVDVILQKYLKERLDNMRDSDVPDVMQDYWLKNRKKLEIKGIWLPANSDIFKKLPAEEAAAIKKQRMMTDKDLTDKKLAKLAKSGKK